MYLIVGLGNPGPEYEKTPHNLGFLTVDWLAAQAGMSLSRLECRSQVGTGAIGARPVTLAKPLAFMNRSGGPVRELIQRYNLAVADLVVIYDDLDLPWSTMRIRRRGSAGGHHGMESVIAALGTSELVRVRLGIGRPDSGAGTTGFLLSPLERRRREELDELVGRAAEAVSMIVTEGLVRAMNRFNRRIEVSDAEEK